MNKRRKILLIIFSIIFLGFGVYTLAKFITEKYHSYFVESKNFYFTSNRLKENNPLYQVNNWSGVGNFDISFDLLSEENSLVYTDYDIAYTVSVTCPNDVVCTLDKTSGTIYTTSTNHSDSVNLSVSPQRAFLENESITIHVEASSTSPYVKTVSADFQYIVGKQGVTYEVEDEANRAYLLLKITNAISYCTVVEAFNNYSIGDTIDVRDFMQLTSLEKKKCVSQNASISFDPSVLLLDTTQSIIDESTYTEQTINSVDYINGMSFIINPMSTVVVKFYKINNTNDYTYPLNNNTCVINVNISDPI